MDIKVKTNTHFYPLKKLKNKFWEDLWIICFKFLDFSHNISFQFFVI